MEISPSSPHGKVVGDRCKVMQISFEVRYGNLLTFEELTTVLIQIEACLNSRSICQIPSMAADLQTLTPGYFLIGGPLTVFPDIDMMVIPIITSIADRRFKQLRKTSEKNGAGNI